MKTSKGAVSTAGLYRGLAEVETPESLIALRRSRSSGLKDAVAHGEIAGSVAREEPGGPSPELGHLGFGEPGCGPHAPWAVRAVQPRY